MILINDLPSLDEHEECPLLVSEPRRHLQAHVNTPIRHLLHAHVCKSGFEIAQLGKWCWVLKKSLVLLNNVQVQSSETRIMYIQLVTILVVPRGTFPK